MGKGTSVAVNHLTSSIGCRSIGFCEAQQLSNAEIKFMRTFRRAILSVGACSGLLFPLVFSPPQHPKDMQTVLLAAHRAGRVEVLDPATLAPLGSINVLPLADGIRSSPDGSFLYVREGIPPDFKGCCALYALNLETRKMTRLVEPSRAATVSPNGNHVVTQRGNMGIEVFNGCTLEREPRIPRSIAPGFYSLSFSPNGSFLLGITNSPPSLDMFDFASRQLVRSYPVSGDVALLGAWLRDDFYLYAYQGADGQLWKVNPQNATLGLPLKVSFPDAAPECAIHEEEMVGVGNRIFLYEAFGDKGDRRSGCKRPIPGGVLSIGPETGKVIRRLADGVHFNWVVPSPDGKELYGIDVTNPNWDSVGLVRLDAETGNVLAKTQLTPDVWFIDLASLPRKLVPHGELEAVHD